MDNIVINISNIKFIDELLKNNSEVKIKIKKQILSNWYDRNLRPKIDEETAKVLIPRLEIDARKTIREAVKEEFKYEELEPYVRQTAAKIINKIVDDELRDLIAQRVQYLAEKYIKKTQLTKRIYH